ncbi:MAG: hypothetical protein OEU51_02815 [Gammaproteobacteria bacterium]|nr:hypothetical protein [Gammaproteobacteria bacterium]
MGRVMQIIGQAIAYSLFAIVVGYFATRPAYTHLEPGKAVIKLSFSHAGAHIEECRQLTQEELNRLAPNMRRPVDCPRERLPLLVEVELDGELIYREELEASGLASDGASTAYKKFPVDAGQHHLVARLRDSRRTDGFDHGKSADITLMPQQNFVIDFRPELGGFLFL